MRILITAIILWVILLGSFAVGMKVMATSPQVMPVQAVETVSSDNPSQATIERDSRTGDDMTSANQPRNGLRLNR